MKYLFLALMFVLANVHSPQPAAVAKELKVLFLGDNGPHRPRQRLQLLKPALSKRGIQLVYTESVADLNAENLNRFDALLLYANIDTINPAEEKALLDYVAAGAGFVPLHCATFCFRNSEPVIALMGAQFQRHGAGVFRATTARADHPIMDGFGGFESWDETYVHHKHNQQDREVLEYRVDAEGREPWTWTRTHGKGRVFYTAWGHDHRTWSNEGFHNLVERGIRWAVGGDPTEAPAYMRDRPFPVPEMTAPRTDVAPFEMIEVATKIPNYAPGENWGATGKNFSTMPKPLSAEESLKHMIVPEGFRVELFASEPEIVGKPICMAWDERGRLWVAETIDYPNDMQPEGLGNDRIRILEDANGDGQADRSTVFADKLSIPTSIAFSHGGVIVHQAPHTLFLEDTDGDDQADVRKVLFTGWGTHDTHSGPSNLNYGHDNWFYGNVGYSGFKGSVAGDEHSFYQGFYRFQIDRVDGEVQVKELEFLRNTNNNSWGVGLSEEGILFGSTANGNPSTYMPIANRYYERVQGWTQSLVLGSIADNYKFKPVTDKVRQVDVHGGYTAAAGHALYTARTYPPEYWNRTAFVNAPTGHLIGTFLLKPEGSNFSATSPFNLVASDDEWTAPIMSEVGPDGHMWMIDWYNYIIQHNPTPEGFKTGKGSAYVSDLRDKKHARIYRVVYGGSDGAAKTGVSSVPTTLADASSGQLVRALAHPNLLWRRHAQRLLVERGKTDITKPLVELVRDGSTDEIGLNVGAIHALWTLHGLGALEGSPLVAVAWSALKHSSAGVRRTAVAVLPPTPASAAALLDANLLIDLSPQVRLAALLALADMPRVPEVGDKILAALERPINSQDRWIPEAATSAAAVHCDDFLAAVCAADNSVASIPKVVEISGIVAEHYARRGAVDSLGGLLAGLTNADPSVANAIVGGLNRGWPVGTAAALGPGAEADLERLLSRLSLDGQAMLIKLLGSWGSERFDRFAQGVTESLYGRLDDADLSVEDRVAAAHQLVEFQPNRIETATAVLDRITPQTPPTLAEGIVRATRASQAPGFGAHLVDRFSELMPRSRKTALSVLLSRAESTQALLDAVDRGAVQLVELSIDQKRALAEHPDKPLQERAQALLAAGGALPNPDRQKVLDELMPLAQQVGDPVAGQLVFKQQCAKCHIHGREGNHVGPNLTGMAVHPKSELLMHLIDPSRSVEGNYRVYTVVTLDGLVASGMLASESKTTVELIDAEGKQKVILRADIEQLVASPKSLMPDGFEKQVKPRDITDLLEFLTRRGKFLPLDLSSVATIASDRGMFIAKESSTERLVFPDWGPKTFGGIPFHLTDPEEGTVSNVILLHGPHPIPKEMPKSVRIPWNGPARAIHMLSGVSGWGYPVYKDESVSLTVRLHYADRTQEDHELRNGIHFADYIRRIDVPGSEHAFDLDGRQVRYLVVRPKREEVVTDIELVEGDFTAPVVMAVTVEGP